MQYDMLAPARQRTMIEDNIANLETQHWQKVLDKLANPNNPAGRRQLDEQIANLEAGIASLRAELANHPLPASPPVGGDPGDTAPPKLDPPPADVSQPADTPVAP